MKIAIMGAGAMGSLFGAHLTLAGEEVWLVDVRKEQTQAIASNGLSLEEKGKVRQVPMNATDDIRAVGKADLVIFFVKAYHTEKAVTDAFVLQKEDTAFLTLQNGLGNEEAICKYVDPRKVMLGVTNHGATLLGPGRIRHAGWGKTYLGELNGEITGRLKRIAEVFSRADLETEVAAEINAIVWNKLFVNVGINALTALTGLRNGQLLEHPETLQLLEILVAEAAEVARKKGIRIEGDPVEHAKRVAEATRENRSSMGQDFDNHRKTEIDAINGAVVREAKKLAMSAPCNQTVTNLIRVIEKQF
jgi:2-dehydropantoate 2-reductase